MKTVLLTVALLAGLASAYCEFGRKVNQRYVGGGQVVTYVFSQGKMLDFRFAAGESIPYSIKFDFYTYTVCSD
jgi:hypothetical protein